MYLELIRLGAHKEQGSLDSYYQGNVRDTNTDDFYKLHLCVQFAFAHYL